ncbi:MAG: excinuclease ABC subunit UvrC [Pseudomonadota bacterium]
MRSVACENARRLILAQASNLFQSASKTKLRITVGWMMAKEQTINQAIMGAESSGTKRVADAPVMPGAESPAQGVGAPAPSQASCVSAFASVGVKVIADFAKTLPDHPGVYRMLNKAGDSLYIGKARSLRRRVTSYTQLGRHPERLLRMISLTTSMDVTLASSETEALLLEASLIKQHKPRFNVLLRDSKSFPQIALTAGPFPRMIKHRGKSPKGADLFGPFADARALNRALTSLQRAFLLRNCTDSVFAARTRPCLQYQIKRCSAPCVGLVDEAQYAQQVRQAKTFLRGKSRDVFDELSAQMSAAADKMAYESAAALRNRIRALSILHTNQGVHTATLKNADVVSIYQNAGQSCVYIFFYRGGTNYGGQAFYPSHPPGLDPAEVLSAFLSQFYSQFHPPSQIFTDRRLPDQALLSKALTRQNQNNSMPVVNVSTPHRGEKRQMCLAAQKNARDALLRRLSQTLKHESLMDAVAKAFGRPTPIHRIEVYDNSHISGRHALGVMIVAGREGFERGGYRKYNLDRGGDDYAMMRDVLTRRLTRLMHDGGTVPDLMLIDGGRGQLNQVCEILHQLEIQDIYPVGIAKGPNRKDEQFYLPDRKQPLVLDRTSEVFFFLQRLRDEAHRFAIAGHRGQRKRAMRGSILDSLTGVGPIRKRALLRHFGSSVAVARAGVKDLMQVEGISKTLAQEIFDQLYAHK